MLCPGAQALLNHNAKVYIGGRDPKRVAGAIEDLRKETGKEALFLQLDLADLQSIKRAVVEFVRYAARNLSRSNVMLYGRSLWFSKEIRLDVLFNSGGVMIPPIEQTTKDGFDLQFGTNVIGG